MRVLDVDAPAAPGSGKLWCSRALNAGPVTLVRPIIGYAWLIIRFDRTPTSSVGNYGNYAKNNKIGYKSY